jgi:methionine-rich copper-binding protein CopC
VTSGRLPLLLGVVFLGLVAFASPVFAHSDLKESSPVDGQTMRHSIDGVDLVFWSPLSDPAIEVVGPDGAPIEGHTTQVDEISVRFGMEPLTDEGEYIVHYEVRGGDGDLTNGSLAFVFVPESAGRNGAILGWVVVVIAVALIGWGVGRVASRETRSGMS